jgi:hypothetical protein
MASPALWQRIAIGAAWASALALGGLLAAGYGAVRGPWIARASMALLAASLIFGTISWEAWRTYGVAGDSQSVMAWRATMMRSIPTEADARPTTALLPAGALAIADKSFLGWVHLTAPSGASGWVRSGEVIPLWRAP